MADRPTALATAPLRGEGLERLRAIADVVLDPWIDQEPLRIYSAEELAERIDAEGADLLVVESDAVTGPVLERPLRAIGVCRGDPVNVDLAAASAAEIPVVHTPGRNADAVAEMTVALLMAVNRSIVIADADMRAGRVFAGGTIPYQRFRAWQVAGRVFGIVGLGAVGRATRWRMEGLGMTVISHDPYADDATHSLPDLLAESDVVSMHAPVTEETAGMMGAAQFLSMRDGAVYLNTARAALHDVDALVDALRSGKLRGAGLDHVDGEVLPEDHPLIGLRNVVLTPHIGGATYDTEAVQTTMVADDFERILRGDRPEHAANPDLWS
ncbi:MAG: NAD(P)-dependent oxidoreductase [Acidimicrobiia bacterium]